MITVYLFATLNNGFASYPHDHAHELFQDALKKVKSDTQIVLTRKDNLLYYCYIKRIANQQLFGICLCINNIYVDTEYMFQAFDTIFTKAVTEGTVLKMDEQANIQVNVEKFVNESVAINELSRHLQSLLDIDNPNNNILLPPADFSISVKDCIELNIEQNKELIIDAIKRYSNVYIVKTHDEIARITEVANVIKSKNNKIQELKQSIDEKDDEIKTLNRQKKNYKLVIWLIVFICIGGIVFISTINSRNNHIQELKNQNQEQQEQIKVQTQTIEEINSDLSAANTRITSLNQTIHSKDNTISELNAKIEDKDSKIKNLEAKINNVPPIITDIEIKNNGDDYGKTIYSSKATYLYPKVTYVGFSSGYKTFKVKWYDSKGVLQQFAESPPNFTFSDEVYISMGSNTTTSISGYGNSTPGKFWKPGTYRIEIWCNNICLKTEQITIEKDAPTFGLR